jgi:membrane associated rhomboid family serine protease
MLPRLHPNKLVSGWITMTLAASVIAAIDGGWLASWAAFAPARIWRGELWRLVTWAVVERGAFNLLLTCACIYKFGGELVALWGERRLRRFLLEVLGLAAAVALLVALVSDDASHVRRLGGWAVCDVLTIAWARQFSDRSLLLYGLVQMSGRRLITVTIAITCVYAVFSGPLTMALELAACGAALWYPSARLRRI